MRCVEVTAIIKAVDTTTIAAPDDARDTRVSWTWRFPLCGALTDDSAQNLVDDACMGNNQNSLSDVLTGDNSDSSHDTPSKVRICLAARPGEVLVVLGFILEPEFGILLSHIIYRKPVDGSTIDFGKRLPNADGSTDVLGGGSCCVERSAKRAGVHRVEGTFKSEAAAEQIDLPVSFFGQSGIVSAAQKRAFVPATLHVRVADEQKGGGQVHCAAHLRLMCGKPIKEHLTLMGVEDEQSV
jgi:hypothetical protein